MDKVKKTFKELNELAGAANVLFGINKDLLNGKFGYAYKRFEEKNLKQLFADYRDALRDVRIDHSLTDKKTGALLQTKDNNRGFQYDKEGLKAVIKAERELLNTWDLKEVEVEPFIVEPKNLPEELTDEDREKFKGLLIK